MFVPPEHRVPVEIWEKILLEFISAQSMLVLATSCSAADYLIFKRTCGDGENSSHRYEYVKFQQNRRSIRGVCRSWKTSFDQWDQHDRWAYRPSIRENIRPYQADCAWRLDLRGCHALPLISEWKQMGVESLRHFHMRRADPLNNQVSEFLERHAQTIEMIDLDNDDTHHRIGKSQLEQRDIAFPLDFWETFINLKLLRCNWGRMQLESLPEQRHPIGSFVLTDPVEQAAQLCDVLRPWVERQNVKILTRVVLYGYFLTKGYHLCEEGELPRLIDQLAKNGTRLVNPAGKSWI